MDLVLNPVVEFCPSMYKTSDRPVPTTTSAESPEAWNAYWRTCLSDAGIGDLEPIEKGSQLVPLQNLRDPHVFDALLRAELEVVEEWRADFLDPLDGGYVLSAAGRLLKPGCCGDLSNLRDWRRAAEHASEEWAMVWIGHTWTHVSAKADTLTFLQPTETGPGLAPDVLCHVPRDSLKAAIDAAAKTVTAFGERLRPRVAAMEPTIPVDAVLDILLSGHTPTD